MGTPCSHGFKMTEGPAELRSKPLSESSDEAQNTEMEQVADKVKCCAFCFVTDVLQG